MQDIFRDRMILSSLDPSTRAKIEETVDEIIDEQLPLADKAHLLAAARSFDERGETLSAGQKMTALQVAAALRVRALGEPTLH